jgi:hypothetical protein
LDGDFGNLTWRGVCIDQQRENGSIAKICEATRLDSIYEPFTEAVLSGAEVLQMGVSSLIDKI